MVKPAIKFFLVLASTCVTLAGDVSFSQNSKPAVLDRVYPKEPHGFREEKHLIDRMNRILRWFDSHLK